MVIKSPLRSMVRLVLPYELRLQASRLRMGTDRRVSGLHGRLASGAAPPAQFEPQISIAQPIFRTELSRNKISNLKRASEKLDRVPIAPGQALSFWHLIPRPTAANGFREGRSLINGALVGELGGGLCQLSGLIYQLSILAGLKIVERHAHSVDLYTEDTRFAPIGTDATVVYGYKDLVVENSTSAPIAFEILVSDDQITGSLCSNSRILSGRLQTHVKPTHSGKRVIIERHDNSGRCVQISDDHYVLHRHKEPA